jgi:GAF domain-containing protein
VETSRDQEIVHSLVEIADNLIDDFDVVELLTLLTQRCVNLLGFSAAGVMLASPPGELRLGASSSDAMQVVELFELQANEGPCLDAFRSGQRVDCRNLAQGTERWPQFAAVAYAAGFRSVFALPLRLRDATIGALNLFCFEGPPIDENELMVARGFADLAAISILQHGAAAEGRRLNEQLTQALESRILIEQAKGVISERAGVPLPVAFSRLRSYARGRRLPLADVAQAAIDGILDPAAWSEPAPPDA